MKHGTLYSSYQRALLRKFSRSEVKGRAAVGTGDSHIPGDWYGELKSNPHSSPGKCHSVAFTVANKNAPAISGSAPRSRNSCTISEAPCSAAILMAVPPNLYQLLRYGTSLS